ncbi:MAG: hypothetical protein H0U66_10735 [Gemmatimonadaceae bacterium]|nr:hypothetical protein [Gemmatimonadaceae bacterium]
MSDHVPDSASTEQKPQRRPWTAPQLVVHESMMVLTQQFFGVPSGPKLLLSLAAISCVVSDTTPICT